MYDEAVKKEKIKVSKAMYFVSKKVGQAIMDYGMLMEGDKILIAISGGKDSLALLKLLKYRQTFVPIKFEIMAIHIDMGIPNFPVKELEDFFKKEQINYRIEKIDFLKKNETWNDINCFWCSWNRRKALFKLAGEVGFNKIAFGHHMDDIVESILLNLFYKAEIGAMKPMQELFDGKIKIIRPMAYVEEGNIVRLCKHENIPNLNGFICPKSETSQRKQMKELVQRLSKENHSIKQNIFNALKNVKEEYLL